MAQIRIGIVGGGIVGLSVAYKISLRFPHVKIVLFEKEAKLAEHQTGRNSGVIHSGIYYKPGSLKATTCRDGKAQLEAFCDEHSVKWEKCGKVIVALNDGELPALDRIYERGQQNGVECRFIDGDELREREPHVAGIKAIHVPETGIVDYVGFCVKLGALLEEKGHEIRLNSKIISIIKTTDGVTIGTEDKNGEHLDFLVNCAGLYSDKVAQMAGHKPSIKIIPFRGEYYELKEDVHHLCRHLIYPVPDPAFPFLGVHFTRMVLGGVECGPNAVLAFAREGYTNRQINPGELFESLTYGGFIKLAGKFWKTGAGEMHRSFSKKAFVKALSRLIPEISEEHLVAALAGVRAQAISPEGAPVDDFVIEHDERAVHVINAVSPAATACLAIADHIVAVLEPKLVS
ncbi:MAG: L-2-hydroxyglutarate oxidase [Armatimonadota bacterium]